MRNYCHGEVCLSPTAIPSGRTYRRGQLSYVGTKKSTDWVHQSFYFREEEQFAVAVVREVVRHTSAQDPTRP